MSTEDLNWPLAPVELTELTKHQGKKLALAIDNIDEALGNKLSQLTEQIKFSQP